MKNIESLLKDRFSVTIDRFKERVVGKSLWLPRSILMSEAFAFCAIAEMLEVDAIVESGVWHGRSTHVWARFFNPEVPIVAVERRRFKPSTIARFEAFENVKLLNGDGLKKVPMLVNENRGERVAVMIDGPKYELALGLAKAMMEQSKVVMVAIHDMYKSMNGNPNASRIAFEGWSRPTFFTDCEWFVKEYGELDEGESGYDADQRFTWYPYIEKGNGRGDRILGSYGETLGVSFKQEAL